MSASFNKAIAVTAATISLFAASGAAFAGARISDRQYWPNEIHASGVRSTGTVFDAQASLDYQAPSLATNSVMYRGGPKTGTR